MINKLKRLWYRLNSVHVWPEGVMKGDRLLFDFPGTGPYWTSPVNSTKMTWGPWPQGTKEYLSVWMIFDNGSLLAEIHCDDLRRKR